MNNPNASNREETLFVHALALASDAAREAFLSKACAGDAALRTAVEALLAGHARQDGILDESVGRFAIADTENEADATADRMPGRNAEPLGTLIAGRYKLLEQIGEGGMGVVYMADQERPVRRRVAVKIVKAGMDSAQVIARFEAERQALAVMDHPSIARVYDAGTTDTGRPFFVMELVQGLPITQYCDAHRLPIRQRLDLFIQVCQAVQHAHTKGIIHRDLKPTNILVATADGKPLPKVIDFGVAKALHQRLTDRTLFTGFGAVVGTLEYMSPEQAEMDLTGTDTRSDIYSLGVLLYELLTGSTPLDRARLKKVALNEMLRIIREEEPPRPSTRISQSSLEVMTATSERRGTDATRLGRSIAGDLDWIVMRSMEKDRNRRYETASAFANDVQRFLTDQPIEARPPSVSYKFRKFARRNKAPVLAGTLVLITLLGGVVGTTLGLLSARKSRLAESQRAEGETLAKREAEQREAETNAVLAFVENNIIAAARPEGQEGGLGHDVTLRKAVEAALPFVDATFTDRPLIEARLRATLGKSFLLLGDGTRAAEQSEKARALYVKHRGPDHPDTLLSTNNLANSYAALGRFAETLKLHDETLNLRKARLGPDHPDTLISMNNVASSYFTLGRLAEALKLREETLALQKVKLGPDHPDTLRSMNNLAWSYVALGRHAEALKLYEETLALSKAKLGHDHPDTLRSMNDAANSYAALRRHAEALKLHEETLALSKAKLGHDHPDTLRSMNGLGNSYRDLGRHAEAVKLHAETLTLSKAKLGPDHPQTLLGMNDLANSYAALGRRAEALKLHAEWLTSQKAKRGPDHPDTLNSVNYVAHRYSVLGWHADALKLYEERLAIQKGKLGAGHADTLRTFAMLGRFDEALTELDGLVRITPPNHWNWFLQGCVLAYLGREADYREHCRAMLEQFPDSEPSAPVLDRIAKAALLYPVEAGGDVQRLLARARKAHTINPSEPYFDLLVGIAEYRAGRPDAAISPLEKCRAPDNPARTAAAEAFLAMVHHQLAHPQDARAALTRSILWIENDLPKPGVAVLHGRNFGIEDWLVAQIARREAEALLGARAVEAK